MQGRHACAARGDRRWEMTAATSGGRLLLAKRSVFLAPPKKSSGCSCAPRGCVPGLLRQQRAGAQRQQRLGQPCGEAAAA